MTSPTFLICGGQRCGTTALWHLLNQHPDVFMAGPPVPEPKYFLSHSTESIREYEARWFAGATGVRAIGEKSTSYLEVPGTAERIHAAYPSVRLIFLFRHPAERAVSNFLLSVTHGLESRDFDTAVAQSASAPLHKSVSCVSPFDYLRRGHYEPLLQQFVSVFPEDQLLYLFFEDLVAQPEFTCRSVYRFVGVEERFLPDQLEEVRNAGPKWGKIMSKATLDFLIAEFQESNRRLADRTGRDLTEWNRPTQRLLDCIV